MERSEKFLSDENPDDDAAPAPRLCKCGRAPWRQGQRNCVHCNRDANRKYRESLKRDAARLKKLSEIRQ
jgi:hypothetical protein